MDCKTEGSFMMVRFNIGKIFLLNKSGTFLQEVAMTSIRFDGEEPVKRHKKLNFLIF